MNRSTKIELSENVHDRVLIPSHTAGGLDIPSPYEETENEFYGNHYIVYFPFSSGDVLMPAVISAFEKMVVYASLILTLPLIALSVPYILIRQKKSDESAFTFALKFIPRLLHKELSVCMGLVTLPSLLLANTARWIVLLVKNLF